jgi:hypothetical protein
MRRSIATAMVVAATTAFAGAGVRPVYILAVRDARPVSVSLVRTADFVAMPVSIVSEQKETARRFDDIRAAKRLIQDKAIANKGMTIRDGPLSLSARPVSKMAAFSSFSHMSNHPRPA